MAQKLEKIRLRRVQYVPKTLEPGILYVAQEFGAAVHLCACGCGCKVSTPLTPTEWTLEETSAGPSLRPSVGNWQLPCKSHYWISKGNIAWSETWTPEEILAGRQAEERRRSAYFEDRKPRRGVFRRLWHWLRSFFE